MNSSYPLVEELRFVTRPSDAPVNWATLTLQGRHMGLTLIGTSQRPAHIDKDFFGNATLVHAGVRGFDKDMSVVAKAMRIPAPVMAALKPLERIEREKLSGEPRRGQLKV